MRKEGRVGCAHKRGGSKLETRNWKLPGTRSFRSGIDRVAFGSVELILEGVNRSMRLLGGLRRRVVQVDGCRWFWLDGGDGEAVVVLHGFGADKDRFWTFLPSLGRRNRVIAPDLPGFGESYRDPEVPYDIAAQAGRVHRFLQAIGLDSFHLAGISMGGAIAAAYAAEHPRQVKTLFLMAPLGARSPNPSVTFKKYTEQGKNLFLYRNLAELDELLDVLFFRPRKIPKPIRRYLLNKALAEYRLREKIVGDLLGTELEILENRLNRIEAETLILWGRNDRVIDVTTAAVLAERIAHSRVVILEECGHVPFFEKPEETIGAYREFLGKKEIGKPKN